MTKPKKSKKKAKKKESKVVLPERPDMYVLAKEDVVDYHSDFGHDGPWSGYTEETLQITPYALHASQQNDLNTRTFPCYLKDPEKAFSGYVLWVIYGDGGTFGFTSGYIYEVGIFDTEEECLAIKKVIEEGGGGPGGDARPWKAYMAEHYPDKSRQYPGYMKSEYASWVGYFSTLEGVEYERFIIQRP